MYSLDCPIFMTIISEYLGIDCKTYLEYLQCENDFKYLYETYHEDDDIKKIFVRYLNTNNVLKLNEYINIIDLIFDCTFNQKIEPNVLPNSLQYLTFGKGFNQKIELNVLPNSLQSLTFGLYFDQEIKQNVLPNSLLSLTFNTCFNQKIKQNVLPNSLQSLTFGY